MAARTISLLSWPCAGAETTDVRPVGACVPTANAAKNVPARMRRKPFTPLAFPDTRTRLGLASAATTRADSDPPGRAPFATILHHAATHAN